MSNTDSRKSILCHNTVARYRWALLAVLLGCSIAQAGEWLSETLPSAPEAELCQKLLQRLNSLPQRCARDALESYPKFQSPPWQKLEPSEHAELITRLIVSQGLPVEPTTDVSRYRSRALDFINRGGELYVWHTRLLSNFSRGVEGVAPPGNQVVVLLADRGGSVDTSGTCPGRTSQGWSFGTYVVLPDLSGPDTQVERPLAHTLALTQPVLYRGETLLVHSAMDYGSDSGLNDGAAVVWKDFAPAAGLRAVCSFRFDINKPRHRKGK